MKCIWCVLALAVAAANAFGSIPGDPRPLGTRGTNRITRVTVVQHEADNSRELYLYRPNALNQGMPLSMPIVPEETGIRTLDTGTANVLSFSPVCAESLHEFSNS